MQGSTFEELIDRIIRGHEVEFIYNDEEYDIELDQENGLDVVKIWKYRPDGSECISTTAIENELDIVKVFEAKVFYGKSFYEIEKEVIIDTVF